MPGKLDIDVTFELQSGTKDDFVMTFKGTSNEFVSLLERNFAIRMPITKGAR